MVAPGDYSAVVLLGHGARDPEWRRPIESVLALMRAELPDVRSEVAFHEFIGPSLRDMVATLHAAGHRQIIVVPVFIAPGGHLRHEIPAEIVSLSALYPDSRIALAAAIGEAPVVQAAIVAHCRQILSGET